ncbi:DNA polymerase III subunit alpha, partial [bacterium]|nr:DNA polymerase III subunit alpha [bacterium]
KNLVKRLMPDVFDDIGAIVALFRPGPLDSGMVDKFVDRKHGKVVITYPHPLLEPVLKDTYGTIVYQEQIMQVFQILADYSLGQADMVRRMMGKKKVDEMQKQKGKFIENASKHNMSEKDATELFEDIEKFASYCFNRSHSAAYAFVAYQTAYLKCHYPVEYMACLLSSVSSDQDKTQAYIEESLAKGIKILSPDINKSNKEFTPDGENIRFGLASIKQVGEVVIEQILEERNKNGEFTSIYDFCTRVDSKCTNKRVLEGLIKSGAFSTIEKSRKQLLENIEHLVAQANKEAKAKELGQCSLFAGTDEAPKFELIGTDEEFSSKEIQIFEKEFLGFYVTSHPLASIRKNLPFLTTHSINEIPEIPTDKLVTICGLITSARAIKKDPSKFLKVITIEDLTGKIECICFAKKLAEYDSILNAEEKVIISGKVSRRDESSTSIIIDTAKSVENANIFTISLKEEIPYEELVLMKDIMFKHNGSDPVMIRVETDENPRKIVTASNFWVQSSNELVYDLKKYFNDRIDINIKSMS